ncbi:hypothetical protein FDB61_18625 [Clostridium botulinum]|nr:hypothetical protein [Clostridium botulinum]
MKRAKKITTLLVALSIIGTNFTPVLAQAAEKPIDMPQTIDITDNNENSTKFKVSERLTYDQLVDKVVENENISVEEAREFLGNREITRSYRDDYRTYETKLDVKKNYKPTLCFYCETSEWGPTYVGIKKVLNTSLNRKYKGDVKQFSGTIYTNLESANTIYFEVNGEFYNYGSTTCTGGVEIGIGEHNKVSFSVSDSGGEFKYVKINDRYNLHHN